MITTLDQLVRARPDLPAPVVATSGGFDPLHVGHLACLRAAAALGATLIVIVNGDGYLRRKKGFAFMPLADRMEIIDALRWVDWTVGFDDGSQVVSEAVRRLRPDIFAKGVHLDNPTKLPEWQACREVGCRVVLDVGGHKIRSSSQLLDRHRRTQKAR